MTTDSRKIQLETGVDATGAKAGFAQVKDAAKDMATSVAQSGQQASKGLDGVADAGKKAADGFTREEGRLRAAVQRATLDLRTLGKTASEKFEAKIELQGLDASKFAPYIAQLRALEQQAQATAAATARAVKVNPLDNVGTSLGASSFVKPLGTPSTSLGASAFGAVAAESQKAAVVAQQSLQKIGVSAGQTQAALRQLPAQFSDIVVSLQGGQKPLSVFLQQGSQIKDSFGGVVPALKAVGGAVLGMINPLTVGAAAVGTLGYAFLQGAKESTEYNKALILTGNYLGLTISQFQVYAKTISSTVGTQGAAAEALTALASSGKVAAASLTEVGTAVVLMNRVLGVSVDEATATFVKLADEPTKASQKLNESMHYLNLATYERIRALEDQGDKEAAAALAQATFATETTARLKRVEASAGTLERAWRSLADGAKSAWDQMLGIGRQQSIGDALAGAQKKLNESQAQSGKGGFFASLYAPSIAKQQQDVSDLSRRALREQENAYAQGEKARTESAKIASSDRLKKLSDEVQTNADKRKKAIKELDKDFETLGKAKSGSEYDKLVANINDKYKDPKEAKVKAYQDDQGTKTLELLRQQEAALKAQLDTNDKLTAADQERAKYIQLFADLKEKKVLTADQKSLLANQDAIRAQLDQNVAVEKLLEIKKEATKEAEKVARLDAQFSERARQRTESIANSLDTQKEQYDRIGATRGLGDRARQEVEAQRSIYREYSKMQLDLVKNTPEHLLGSDKYNEEAAKIKEGLESAIQAQKDFFADEKAAREDWLVGAKTAFANYNDEATNAAKHTEEAFTNALKGIEDQFTNLLTGKKFDFKKLVGDIQTDLTRNFVKENITGPLSKLAGDAIGDGGILSGLLGSSKKGGERGASASNPLFVRLADALGLGGATGGGSGGGLLGGLLGGSGSSGGGLLGLLGGAAGALGGTGAQVGLANALPGDSLDNLLRLTSNFKGFADGGSPPIGKISMVGERGPELFVPKQAGTIIPNASLSSLGGNVTNINVGVEGRVDRRTRLQIAGDISMEQRRAGRYA